MGDPKYATYNSSTLLRALCFFGLGYEIAIVIQGESISIENILFLAAYAFGIFASAGKKGALMKAFAVAIILLAIERSFFQYTNFSGTKVTNPVPSKATGLVYTGIENITLLDGVQLALAVIQAALAWGIS